MLKTEDCTLVIIDVQGKLAQVMHETTHLHQQLATLIAGIQLFDIPILWVEQLPDKLGKTSDELTKLLSKTGKPITKAHFSAYQCDEFKQALTKSGRQHILLAGIECHVCVYQTCAELIETGFSVSLITDATSSRLETNKQDGIALMRDKGAKIHNTEALLFELQHVAHGERFKSLLKLIK